jgi:hypothetical protein
MGPRCVRSSPCQGPGRNICSSNGADGFHRVKVTDGYVYCLCVWNGVGQNACGGATSPNGIWTTDPSTFSTNNPGSVPPNTQGICETDATNFATVTPNGPEPGN